MRCVNALIVAGVYTVRLSSARNGSSEISRFKHTDAIETRDGIMFIFYLGLPHMPSTVTGNAWKLARLFHFPYRVLNVTPTNVEAWLVDQPDADSIFVAVSRMRPCYPELSINLCLCSCR